MDFYIICLPYLYYFNYPITPLIVLPVGRIEVSPKESLPYTENACARFAKELTYKVFVQYSPISLTLLGSPFSHIPPCGKNNFLVLSVFDVTNVPFTPLLL